MNALAAMVLSKARTPAGLAVLGLTTVFCIGVAFRPRPSVPEEQDPEKRLFVKVKRVVSGQKLKLDNDQDEYLLYAGLRAPVGGETFYDESTRRNGELVAEREIRLRFDDEHRDAEGRLLAYAFIEDLFVNEVLVREGLAYVRLTRTENRFGERLLAAQAEARKAKRGVWSKRTSSSEAGYSGDPKYGNFHRPTCENLRKIDASRLVKIKTDGEALDKGFAPCVKCKP